MRVDAVLRRALPLGLHKNMSNTFEKLLFEIHLEKLFCSLHNIGHTALKHTNLKQKLKLVSIFTEKGNITPSVLTHALGFTLTYVSCNNVELMTHYKATKRKQIKMHYPIYYIWPVNVIHMMYDSSQQYKFMLAHNVNVLFSCCMHQV